MVKIMAAKIPSVAELPSERLVELMQMGHPNQHGESYTRFEVMAECTRRGKRLLNDLGWPTDPNTLYYNRYCPDKETLASICDPWKWGPFKRAMYELEQKLHAATNNEFREHCGLECSTLKEWKQILKRHPEITPLLRESVRLHKGFYEHVIEHIGGVRPIGQLTKGDAICERNISALAKWLQLDVNAVEPLDSLPKPDLYQGVWTVVENWSPEPPSREDKLDRLRDKARGGEPAQATLDLYMA